MPSFFYHLNFELYPQSESPEEQLWSDQDQHVWVPSFDCDIFAAADWPSHKATNLYLNQERLNGRESVAREGGHYLAKTKSDPEASVGGGIGVIECGAVRASNGNTEEKSVPRTLRTIVTNGTLELPAPAPERVHRDLNTAKRDWRFGKVRVESFDMTPPGTQREHRPGHTRGESSVSVQQVAHGNNAINAGLAAGGMGRVTKARYEVVEGKNTEVGRGIVHLYRDGEETPELGLSSENLKPDLDMALKNNTAGEKGSASKEDDQIALEDCTTLCIPAVPSYLTSSDFMGFVGEKTREQVSHFRMVMTARMNRYLVLMKFRDSSDARNWRKEWDGKVFNSMEPETCHVVFIKSITFQTLTSSHTNKSFPELSYDPFTPSSSTSNTLKPFPPPTPNLVELPTCPVCLERMDDTTGLMTILCQHVFHCACLQKWEGSGCPVCRATNPSQSISSQNSSAYPYDPANPPFGSGEASLCSVCDCTDDLWICLICGNVGCGRYKGAHAKEHWKNSAHNFALEIETQHVWDYAGDLWVHRLIRGKGDSKVIELPSDRRSGLGGRDDHRHDMDMVPREKLEGIGIEYTHLLTSQLESQRVYFEDLVSKAVAKASAASSAATNATSQADEAINKMKRLELENRKLREEVVIGLEKDLAREKKKAEKSSEVARGFGKSLMEEKKVSEGLMERIGHINKDIMDISTQLTSLKEENADLQEQNRDLLFSITAQHKLKEMEEEGGGLEAGELEGGTLILPPEKKKGRGRGRGRGKGK